MKKRISVTTTPLEFDDNRSAIMLPVDLPPGSKVVVTIEFNICTYCEGSGEGGFGSCVYCEGSGEKYYL